MEVDDGPVFASGSDGFDYQRARVKALHDQDITHIIAAEGEFASLFPPSEADTLIWLQTPPSNARNKITCTGMHYPDQWLLRYSSAVLRNSGFDKFTQLLDNKRYQAKKASDLRASGLLATAGLDNNGDRIRYVLDLGPSTDFDLRSEHLEALTLPKGIVQYSVLTEIDGGRRVPSNVAAGHDDACSCFTLYLNEISTRDSSNAVASSSSSPPASATPFPPFFPPPAAGDEGGRGDGDGYGGGIEAATLTAVADTIAAVVTEPTEAGGGQEGSSATAATTATTTTQNPPECALSKSIWDTAPPPELRIPDYCEIRHIANVIRLLLAMTGRPLLLNSAARVYTIAGLAKLFGMRGVGDDFADVYSGGGSGGSGGSGYGNSTAHSFGAFSSRLRSLVYDWFFSQPIIVDVLPEESFCIAWNMRLSSLVRVAYRILVAERALQDAGSSGNKPRTYHRRQKTPFGRELTGLLDDDIETMLDHASEALIHRMSRCRAAFVQACGFAAGDDGDGTNSGHGAQLEEGSRGQPVGNPTSVVSAPGNNRLSGCDRLQAAEKVLAEFVRNGNRRPQDQGAVGNEKTSAGSGGVVDQTATEDSVVEALAAVRLLLDKIRFVVDALFPPSEVRSRPLPSGYSEADTSSLSLYARVTNVRPAWFASVYNKLPEEQKRITSTYWSLLQRHIDKHFTLQLNRAGVPDLIDVVNAALFKAVSVSAVANDLREALWSRLELTSATLWPEAATRTEIFSRLFTFSFVRNDLHLRMITFCRQFYDRSEFNPEFEFYVTGPSPHLLLGLTAHEFRFLPLWAGGDDDGTGAVFQQPLPTAQLGPISPGPAYHTGTTNVGSSSIGPDDALSAVARPTLSEAGTETFTDVGADADADTTTDRGGSVSSSFVLVRDLDGLKLRSVQGAASQRGVGGGDDGGGGGSVLASTADTFSSHASRVVQDGHSSVTGAHTSRMTPSASASTSGSSFDMVMVDPMREGDAANDGADARAPSSTGGNPFEQLAYELEHDGDDDIYDYNDINFDEENDSNDDDDENADARSDNTVMPDREEGEPEHGVQDEVVPMQQDPPGQ
ncbi:hypothetical protein SPI_04120 [Niveomyces insectorum RCEF 264]|uniref:Uncharacterized protein n=1 Tax=Niveomyces insectorum RCEF 264 TaxID=1081102 RepID=A0A167VG87_9HYPO|nr:hypothetical protein SPI_04120 [Niveomyces insectorum RCEF 264]